jgi:hypothetical protein
MAAAIAPKDKPGLVLEYRLLHFFGSLVEDAKLLCHISDGVAVQQIIFDEALLLFDHGKNFSGHWVPLLRGNVTHDIRICVTYVPDSFAIPTFQDPGRYSSISCLVSR